MKRRKELSIPEVLEYMDRIGVKYTLVTNPSPEEIERIKTSIKRSEYIAKMIANKNK